MAKIAVITCTYNRPQGLRAVFVSMQNQSFKNFRWYIIHDGGSSEGYEEVFREIEASELECSILKKENTGKFDSLVKAFCMTSERYGVLIDDDDVYHPNSLMYYAAAIKILESRNSSFKSISFLIKHKNTNLIGGLYQNSCGFYTSIKDGFKINRYDRSGVINLEYLRDNASSFSGIIGFMPESFIWTELWQGNCYYFNCIVKDNLAYQADGLTANLSSTRIKAYPNFRKYYKTLLSKNIGFLLTLKFRIQLIRTYIWEYIGYKSF